LVKEQQQTLEPEMDKVDSADIWGYKQEEQEEIKVQFGAMKLVETSQSLFFISETMEVKLLPGELFICFDMSLQPILGVIRHVEREQSSVIQKSVLELSSGNVSLLQQTGVVTWMVGILLSNGAEQHLFIAPGKYKLGQVLKFDQVDIVLERLVELSPEFMCYAVSVREE
ncbi:MAG: hypothetical protein GQ583_05200, partial [Methyloprofundus sp.]|nr:hypothetical protein [Methyloprofundus sp.]